METRDFPLVIAPFQFMPPEVAADESFVRRLAVLPLVLQDGRPAAIRAFLRDTVIGFQFCEFPHCHLVSAKEAYDVDAVDDRGVLQTIGMSSNS